LETFSLSYLEVSWRDKHAVSDIAVLGEVQEAAEGVAGTVVVIWSEGET
jgi:hypothetical protein